MTHRHRHGVTHTFMAAITDIRTGELGLGAITLSFASGQVTLQLVARPNIRCQFPVQRLADGLLGDSLDRGIRMHPVEAGLSSLQVIFPDWTSASDISIALPAIDVTTFLAECGHPVALPRRSFPTHRAA